MGKQSVVEHATYHDAGLVIENEPPEELVQAIEEYFSHFAKPDVSTKISFMQGHPCIDCGEPLGGMLGRFKWGLIHGEGFCSNCNWPARAIHVVKDKEGEELFTLSNVILQYHPDFVEVKK